MGTHSHSLYVPVMRCALQLCVQRVLEVLQQRVANGLRISLGEEQPIHGAPSTGVLASEEMRESHGTNWWTNPLPLHSTGHQELREFHW